MSFRNIGQSIKHLLASLVGTDTDLMVHLVSKRLLKMQFVCLILQLSFYFKNACWVSPVAHYVLHACCELV